MLTVDMRPCLSYVHRSQDILQAKGLTFWSHSANMFLTIEKSKLVLRTHAIAVKLLC